MMNTVYDHPKYYEIAFSWRDIAAEVDTFERCFRQYAGVPLRRILELGCGNSPHLEELLKRGYTYTGLDTSRAMLAYSAEKAVALAGEASAEVAAVVQADMIDFSLPQTFDFAFIALGSLCAENTEEIFSHFHSVARALNKGGLYLLDWCVRFAPISAQDDAWTIERDGIKVTTRFSEKLVDAVEQLVEETISLDVLDGGEALSFQHTATSRAIFPQEFLQIIERIDEFEFVGWWDNWDLDRPLGEVKDPDKISRPIALLRRT